MKVCWSQETKRLIIVPLYDTLRLSIISDLIMKEITGPRHRNNIKGKYFTTHHCKIISCTVMHSVRR
jgi:hypothetical protein